MYDSDAIVHFDLSHLLEQDLSDPVTLRRLYDTTNLVASLQGLANMEEPRLFIRYLREQDDFWWQKMRAEGGWLEKRDVIRLDDLHELLFHFSNWYSGVTYWDERVPATMNVASSIAAWEDSLSLRYDEDPKSLFQELQGEESGVRLPEKKRLIADDGSPMFTGEGLIPGTSIPSTGSAKNDAYRWLIEHYIKKEHCNGAVQGYYIDAFWLQCAHVSHPSNHTLTNHDYIIANQGIVWDLNVWDDEATVDDPGQKPGTDLETLLLLLKESSRQTFYEKEWIQICGFLPWRFKYTNVGDKAWHAGGKHGGVAGEWRSTEIFTCFNAHVDADALGYSAMVNASFYQHMPLPERIEQPPIADEKTLSDLQILDADGRLIPRHYYAHFVGDYDAAAWLYQMMPKIWNDPERGRLPLSWAFNPNLADRFPLGMLWTRQTATPNDSFIAGDSGAGYVNPGHLSGARPYSGFPSGLELWEKRCREYFDRWDIGTVGFILDGSAPPMDQDGWELYERVSPDGFALHRCAREQGLSGGVPFKAVRNDLPHCPQEAAAMIREEWGDSAPPGDGPTFSIHRSILKTPTWFGEVEKEIDRLGRNGAMLVDLRTLLALIRLHEERPTRS